LVIGDLNGVIVEANPAACAMYGFTYDELIGRPYPELIHPDYRHLFAEAARIVDTIGTYRARSINLRKDGTPFWSELRVSPIRDATGRVVHAAYKSLTLASSREQSTWLLVSLVLPKTSLLRESHAWSIVDQIQEVSRSVH